MLMQPKTQKCLVTFIIAFFFFTSVVVAHHEPNDPFHVQPSTIGDATVVVLDAFGYPTPVEHPRGNFSLPGDNIFPDFPMTVSGSNGLETVKVLNPLRPVKQYPVLLRPGEVRRGNVIHYCPDCDDSTSVYKWNPGVPTDMGPFGQTTTSLNVTRVVVYSGSTNNPPSKSGGATGSHSSKKRTPKRTASVSLILDHESQKRPGESDYEQAERLNYGTKTRQALGIAPYTPSVVPNQTLMIEHHN